MTRRLGDPSDEGLQLDVGGRLPFVGLPERFGGDVPADQVPLTTTLRLPAMRVEELPVCRVEPVAPHLTRMVHYPGNRRPSRPAASTDTPRAMAAPIRASESGFSPFPRRPSVGTSLSRSRHEG